MVTMFGCGCRTSVPNQSSSLRVKPMEVLLKGSPRVSLSCGVPFSPRRSPTYNKLPQAPIKLTVLKLDGTSFEIDVMMNGTVAELKKAVEAVFSHLPKTGPRRISWAYVWGRFCLSYDGEKLLADLDCIREYGIKDGDQLEFVRHVSVIYSEKLPRSERTRTKLDEPSEYKGNGDGQLKWQGENRNRKMGKPVHNRVTAVSKNCQCRSLVVLRKWVSYLRNAKPVAPKRLWDRYSERIKKDGLS